MTPVDIRAWADRAAKRKGFGVSDGEPAKIVVAALRAYAAALERTHDAFAADDAEGRLIALLAATHDEDEGEVIRATPP